MNTWDRIIIRNDDDEQEYFFDEKVRTIRQEKPIRKKVTFNTQRYEYSHGKKPRGFGMWWFKDENHNEYTGSGTYTDAKKSVKKEAQRHGATQLTVLP